MFHSTARLKALRRSHCDTCGCNRCKRIDTVLTGTGDHIYGHEEESWLVEGTLSITEKGGLALEYEGQVVSLEEALAGRLGHHVLVLVGAVGHTD